MARLRVVALAACLAAAGCVSEREAVNNQENLLAAAGFTIKPANTPERVRSLTGLPPETVVRRIEGEKVVYLYADPKVCDCLYIGDQAAYGRYQQMLFQRQLARQQQLAAQIYADSAWNWGPWGPGWWR